MRLSVVTPVVTRVPSAHARWEEEGLWVGGRARRSLRRAVVLADGWAPHYLEQLEALAASEGAGPCQGVGRGDVQVDAGTRREPV